MLVEMLPSEACLDPGLGAVPAFRASKSCPHILRLAGQINVSIFVIASEAATTPALLTVMRDDQPEGRGVQVRIASTLLYDRLDEIHGRTRPGEVLIFDRRIVRDHGTQRLVAALVAADAVTPGLGALYINAICVALLTRLLGARSGLVLPTANRRPPPLQKWRLRRVVEHVEAHLADRLTSRDLAAVAGLTRMHFAAQFRAATGVQPHQYLLRRRIERAQELLRDTKRPLVEIALSAGFQTQAHFTTVFRRFTDETPYRWRRAVRDAARPAERETQ